MSTPPTLVPIALPLMVSVASSSIVEIGYDTSRCHLYVRFREGNALYRYEGVPSSVWEAFVAASSKGAYHNGVIRSRFAWTEMQ